MVHTAQQQDYVTLYKEAFEKFGPLALWNRKAIHNPTKDEALAITRALRVEGNLDSRRLAERIERACRAVV